MIKPEMVPEEAIMKAALERWGVNQPTKWEKDTCRIIIAAALSAWPGMDIITFPRMVKPGHFVPQDYIRLPLTEKQDD